MELFLPNARKHAEKHYKFLGNILPFNPQDYSDTAEMKSRLGFGDRSSYCMCRRWYCHWGGPFKSMFSHLQNIKGTTAWIADGFNMRAKN